MIGTLSASRAPWSDSAVDDPRATAAAARDGDPRVFDRLFARNLPRLVAFIRARAGGVVQAKESAHDLAQSVCREALEDIDEFEFRGEEQFRSWLFVRAMRKLYHRHRYHHQQKRDIGREARGPLDDTEVDGLLTAYATVTTPSHVASAREQLSTIESALERLPEAQRDAIALTRLGGLSYAEAALEMNRSEAAVRGLVMRGIARLTTLLKTGGSRAGS